MYGKGRVFYSTFGHTPESFSDPDIKTMYAEAIKWALGLTEGSTTPHAKK
jgi:type 1 glutamine amidotransferase